MSRLGGCAGILIAKEMHQVSYDISRFFPWRRGPILNGVLLLTRKTVPPDCPKRGCQGKMDMRRHRWTKAEPWSLEWYECPACGAVHSGPTLVIDEP
jgi:hypothetical protein